MQKYIEDIKQFSQESKSQYDVSFVLPAYNEEGAVAAVIDAANREMKKVPELSYEILVIDDKSTDDTAKIAASKGVRVVSRSRQGGSGASRKTGIQNSKGTLIVMYDVDGTYDISKLPEMLSYFPEYDQVNGARVREMGTLRLLRTPAKWFLRKLGSYMARQKIPDLNTGFKIFKRDIMLKYLWVIPDGFSCVTTMTLAFMCNGYNVKYVQTGYNERIGKSKFHPIKDTFKYFSTILRIILYFAPMRIFGQTAMLIFTVGLFLSIRHKILIDAVKTSDVVLIVLAVNLFSLGLLAELILSTRNNK